MAKDFDRMPGTLPVIDRPQDEFRFSKLIFSAEEVLSDPEDEDSPKETVLKDVELRLLAGVSGGDDDDTVAHNLRRSGAAARAFLAEFNAGPKAAINAWTAAGDTDA